MATTTTITTITTTTTPRHHYNYNYDYTTPQLQLQLPLQLQVHHTRPHHTIFSSCGGSDAATIPKSTAPNHLSVHQWIRPAIHASQQLTSPMVAIVWNFLHAPCALLV